MVEVKGPGDRLSTKQILWLDWLIQSGISAEVCLVQGKRQSGFAENFAILSMAPQKINVVSQKN